MDGSLEKRLGDLYWSNADIISESAPVLNAPRADALVAFNLTGVPARGSAGGDRYHYTGLDRKSTRLNSSHPLSSRMPSSA